MKPFHVAAQIMGVKALADGGLALNIHTKELPKEEKTEVFEYHLKAGWFLFAPDPIQEKDIPDTPSGYEGRTPSERLRATLFVLHQQRGGKPEEFQSFYASQVEKIISHIKSKLE